MQNVMPQLLPYQKMIIHNYQNYWAKDLEDKSIGTNTK